MLVTQYVSDDILDNVDQHCPLVDLPRTWRAPAPALLNGGEARA
jgi:hypothetical protein